MIAGEPNVTRAIIARGVFGAVVVLFAVAAGFLALDSVVAPAPAPLAAITPSTPLAPEESHPAEGTGQGFLHGRITTVDGATYEGRLRWGSDEEAFWGDHFNGVKHENPWLAHVPLEQRPKEGGSLEIFGIPIGQRASQAEVRRPFMARFGEITRIEARGDEVRVTLKSGTVFDLDRFDASDFDDGVRVWDGRRGVVDLDSLRIRTIELGAAPSLVAAPSRLHGTVRTRQGDFSGFIAWNRDENVGTDELDGHAAEAELHLRLDTIRSITRRSRDSSMVALLDGREIVLSDTPDVGHHNRGTYVDDPRYGRVLISWDAFEHVDFSPAGSGPAYGDFPPGRPLTGSVTTHDGRRLAGRLVYDLDESETTETLDAPSKGVDYTIPFGLIASIVPAGRETRGGQHAKVTLHGGEELQLERTGDLGEGNAGMLIFVDGRAVPEYVPWNAVEHVAFDSPPATYPRHEAGVGGTRSIGPTTRQHVKVP